MGRLTNLNPVAPIADADLPQSVARDAEFQAADAALLLEVDARYRPKVAPESYFDPNNKLICLSSSALGPIAGQGIGKAALEIKGQATGSAFFAFHRPNQYAIYMGLDVDNTLKIGGWSLAGSVPIWHGGYGTPVWQTPSDSRLKKGIRPIVSALSLILEAQPISFRYDGNLIGKWSESEYQRKKVHYGFNADNFPLSDLVTTKENGFLGLDYLEIIPFLVRAIQELHVEIENLKAK
jgi:hypothetical protein